ncbi:MAG: COX15/CtaA family protein [Planctomycetota bacterium]|jgi:cytochrome c oxidase assembly protein subunit 15
MMGEDVTQRSRAGGGDLLTAGLATTVATWAILYVASIPPGVIPIWLAVCALAVCLFGGGYVAGRSAGQSGWGGAGLGVALTAVNLLILLGLLQGGEPGEEATTALWWILGFLVAAVALGALGAAVGRRLASGRIPEINWTARFAWVAAVTTLLMLIAGGVVTGLEAGLAVEGWLNAEGHFLLLFPVSLMRRDVGTFVEHAHRLWGLLVGLTTIMLALHVWMVDRRAWLRWLVVVAVLAVVGQGVLGGTRVTQESTALGVVHGVFALVVFAVLVAIAAVVSLEGWPPAERASVGTDRTLGIALLAALLLQVILGTLFRHIQPLPDVGRAALTAVLHSHSFVGSLLVVVLALFCGVRAWGMYREVPFVNRAGSVLIAVMILQVLLGVGAFIVVPKGPRAAEAGIPAAEVVLTTVHQVNGAILLGSAVALFVWLRRLLLPAPARGTVEV